MNNGARYAYGSSSENLGEEGEEGDDLPSQFDLTLTRKDLKQLATNLTAHEGRYLVDLYYQIQEYRIASQGQQRSLFDTDEPNAAISFMAKEMHRLELTIAAMLDKFSLNEPTGMGAWARCAPAGSLVMVQNRRQVPIETLLDGDGVLTFDRHKSHLTRPRPVSVASRPYRGALLRMLAGNLATETTPEHKWLVRLNRTDVGFAVYLMQAGDRFRVGRSMLFNRRGDDYFRLRPTTRARQEHASVWILKLCSTEREAAIYEEYAATEYGLTEWPFLPPASNLLIDSDATAEFFALLDAQKQRHRAERCLAEHGLDIGTPLWSWNAGAVKQSGTHCMVTAASNLIPEIMEIPAPTAIYGKIDWLPIEAVESRPYNGTVYSLDVAEHHKYIQDGLITCNSIVGIGPVIAAGLVAHVDISHCQTAGSLWRFAGLDPTMEWTGRVAAAELMKAAFDVERTDADAMCWIGRALHRHVSDLYVAAGAEPATRDDAMKTLRAQGVSSEQIQDGNEQYPIHVDNLINNVCDWAGIDAWKVYGKLYGDVKLDKTALRKHISRRPWNARLKSLAWKIGESFVKTSSNPNGFYGKIYLKRKEYELQRNANGELADQAAAKLNRYKIGTGTDAYAAYKNGMLPPAHIHARAKRYAVKLFLSHYFEEAYRRHYKKEPPLPYPIAFLGHAHVVAPPELRPVTS